jgi:hypothetical protein
MVDRLKNILFCQLGEFYVFINNIDNPVYDNSYLESEPADKFDLNEVLIVDLSAQQPLENRKAAGRIKIFTAEI